MIIRNFGLLLLIFIAGLSSTSGKERTEPTISECAAKGGECDETKGRPVCGTDKQTYPTRCHLIRAQCSGHQVSLKHRGACRECAESRAYALSHRSPTSSKFLPKCRADGTFAPIQCMAKGGCWCSDSTGKPIANTTTRNGRPNCRKYVKSTIRRSPARNISSNRNKRACSQDDQALFNTNLLNVFQSEYGWYQRQHAHMSSTIISNERILEWKFNAVDTNKNNRLDKNEFKELKRLVKKIIKPKRCARSFGKNCDEDNDERLTLSEWNSCFTTDASSRGPNLAGGSNGDGGGSTTNGFSSSSINLVNSNNGASNFEEDEDDGSDQHSDDYDEDYEEEQIDDIPRLGPFTGRNPNASVTQFPPVYLLRQKPNAESETHHRRNEGESDCLADRAAALEEQPHGVSAMYIPECTADGRYQRIQCYSSVGYCWCVHEDTGKNIPGTAAKNKQPECDSVYPMSRPMKGCPEPKKTEFLKDLKDFLKVKVASNVSTGANATKWNTEDEKIATLSFVLLDKNKNKVWERKEWKTFRELVTATKQLRKCGKKLPRYCDVNSDKKITLSEWLNCLQAQRIAVDVPKAVINTSEHSTSPKRQGNNPLEIYLKSD